MRAYEYLLEYVKINTTSDENSRLHPSFEGEFDLANILGDKLSQLGLTNVTVDEHAYVYGLLPATMDCKHFTPIAFIAHMDTSPEASGENVSPILHPNYDAKDFTLPSGRIFSIDKFPFLKDFAGETLITSDGTTLLGADDKAGIAEIITALETIATSNISHGDIWVAFTPDEEIGEGTDCFDLEHFPAKYAYTVDGGDVNCIEYENFNAASVSVHFNGLSVHPGEAKNKMINAQNVAHEFHSMLPIDSRPETTEGYEGFYHLCESSGNISHAGYDYIVRDFDKTNFEKRKSMMLDIADKLNTKYGKDTVKVEIEDSYYNMGEIILKHKHLIDNMKLAIESVGLTPVAVPIRGGTDGARLSFDGLPCPNLGTGGYNFHGEYECITAERMDKAVEIILKLIDIYSKNEY